MNIIDKLLIWFDQCNWDEFLLKASFFWKLGLLLGNFLN